MTPLTALVDAKAVRTKRAQCQIGKEEAGDEVEGRRDILYSAVYFSDLLSKHLVLKYTTCLKAKPIFIVLAKLN